MSVPIYLTGADIGRHIKNGELILNGNAQVLYKNYYSFTYPEYRFINHHWFFGVISYVVFHMGGFEGLSVFYIMLLLTAFVLVFDSARRYSDFYTAVFFSVLMLLLLISRKEIRPEGFSVFSMALDFWVLQGFLQRRVSRHLLLIVIPIIQVIWVNTHIFFPLGPMLVGIFLWQAVGAGDDRDRIGILRLLFVLSVLVNIFNPSGLEGMLTPLVGVKNLGFNLSENEPLLMMVSQYRVMAYKYYLFAVLMMVSGMVLCLRREGDKAMPMVVLGALITMAVFWEVRFTMLFGALFIPLAAYFYAPYIKKSGSWFCPKMLASSRMSFLFSYFYPAHPQIGLFPDENKSAVFFKQSGLKGPIFSDYDIGGYLIYHFWGQERFFVDNRVEAFPSYFFQKEYIPILKDPLVWKRLSKKYGFNVIYFSRLDATPQAQSFLVNRIRDPQWAPLFVDKHTIILARRNGINQEAIDRFELPNRIFQVFSNKPQ